MIHPKMTRKHAFEERDSQQPMVQFPVDLPVVALDLTLTSFSLTVKQWILLATVVVV
jgi:hypothetical protein